jgi:4-hydroxy-tetrahydrodipicolinate reductase
MVDFSGPEGAADRVTRASEQGHAVVLGTTGLGPEVEEAVTRAAKRTAIVVAANMSPGISLLRRALRAALPPPALGWDVGMVERHHRAKQDAPSGTAKLLEHDLRETGRSRVEIVSLRQGGVIGEHAVHLAGDDEEIVLIHRAFSRRVFARGALLAARFAAGAPLGRYDMDDVLG